MAIGDFPEGATATHKDGRKIVFRNGEWRVAPGSSASSTGSSKTTEGERKASAFLTRALGANTSYEKQGVGPRGLAGQAFRDAFPNAANYIASDEQQVADTTQDEFIAASLRQDSGAAIPPEEMERQRRIYFPMPGDGEAAIKAKAAARQRAMQGLVASAGAGVDPKLKEQYPDFFGTKGGDPASGLAGAATGGSGSPPAGPGNGTFDGSGVELVRGDQAPETQAGAVADYSTEQRAAIAAVARTGTGDQLKALLTSFGRSFTGTDEDLDKILAFYKDPKNANVAINLPETDNSIKPVDPGDGSVGAFARGITSNLPFSREIAAGINTIAEGDSTFTENLRQEQGYRAYNEQNNGTAYTLGAITGALPLGGIEIAGARAAASAAGRAAVRAGSTTAEARVIANRVFASRTAADAAAQAGVYGVGNADGGVVDRLATGAASAGVGAVTGGAAALAGGRFARALAARRAAQMGAGASPQQQALAAAERQGIVPFPADVGGSGTRRVTSAVAQTMAGAGPIREGAQATLSSAEAVRNRVANSIGTPVGVEEAGETAAQGGRAFIQRTGQRIGRIYDAAAASGGRAQVNATEAVRVLDQELPGLRESPIQGPGVAILEGLRDALNRPQTVRGLREARTQLRDQFESAGLRGSNVERIAGRVVDAATNDLVNGLRAQGLNRAATQYRVADRLWRQRLEVIDETLEPIIGNNASGEEVAKRLQSAMRGNNRRFDTFISALPEAERSTVRASLVQQLGRATSGNQDQAGEVFSLSTFLTNWDKIGSRAKTTLFGDQGRAALNDLATYASQARESQRFANTSNTAGAVANLSALWNFGTLGTALVAERLGGYALSRPAFARWLARAPRVRTPEQAEAHLARLTRVARAEPAIANEVLALQSRLADAFGAAPARLAANERPNTGASVERQDRNEQAAQQRLEP